MAEVSEAQDPLAEVAEKHRPYGLDCKCGRPINSDADWSRHIAAEVGKALGGLTQEQRTLHNGWVQPGYGAMYYACGKTPPPAVITNETRWVSAWTEVTE